MFKRPLSFNEIINENPPSIPEKALLTIGMVLVVCGTAVVGFALTCWPLILLYLVFTNSQLPA